jgi:TRAP-type C4-dicarboxylate transport system permease small subunit
MKFLAFLDKLLTYIAGAAFIALFILNMIQIILRTFTHTSWLWVVDFSQMVFVWIMFLGGAVALHRNEHLLIDFIKGKLPKKVEGTIDVFIRILSLIFYAVIVDTGFQIAMIRMNIKYVTLGWPSGYAYFALPISAIFMILFAIPSLVNSVQQLFGKKESLHHHSEEIGRN